MNKILGYLATINLAPKGETALKLEDQFDFSCACVACGSGAIQKAPLTMRSSDLRSSDIRQTYESDYIVTEYFRDDLASLGTSYDCFRPIINKVSGMEMHTHAQMYSPLQLPEMSPESSGITVDDYSSSKQCSLCKRDNHFDMPDADPEYVYSGLDHEFLNQFADYKIASTYELFGISIRYPKSPPEVPYAQGTGLARARLVFHSDLLPTLKRSSKHSIFPVYYD